MREKLALNEVIAEQKKKNELVFCMYTAAFALLHFAAAIMVYTMPLSEQ